MHRTGDVKFFSDDKALSHNQRALDFLGRLW